MESNVVQKREIKQVVKKGFSTADILLIGILLAAGAVLKFTVGNLVNFGMKPNFIIAMYCLCILLIRPKLYQAIIIGIIAGAVSQFAAAAPFINLVSEPMGALVMSLLLFIPMQIKKFSLHPIISTFISTLISGFVFVGILYMELFAGADVKAPPIAIFLGIILGTATINAIIVQLLYLPLKAALKKEA